MSDWENDVDDDVVVVAVPPVLGGAATTGSKWDDEDADDNDAAKDSWDASDDEDVNNDNDSKQSSSTTTTAVRNKKKNLAQKIAEREEKKKKSSASLQNINDQEEEEDAATRKARINREIEEADLENAKDLFAGVSIKDKDASTGGGGGGVLDSMTVTTRADFDKYLAALTAKIATFEKLPSYAYFVESLLRTITIALPLEDTRKLSTALTALVNEKQKQVTAAMQTGGKKKKNKPMGAKMGTKSTNNNDPYSDMQGGDLYEGEYDDFM